MYRRLMIATTVLFLILATVTVIAEWSRSANPITSGAVKGEVNAYRVQNGRSKLLSSSLLDYSAQARAEFLCNNNVWSHDGWTDSLGQYMTDGAEVGENLEYGGKYQTPRTIVGSWSESPTHNENMLDPVYTEQGMGIKYCAEYQGDKEVVIVVNHFGRR
jgi:uncharacterized protein YkwD